MAIARLANFLNPKPDSLAEWKSQWEQYKMSLAFNMFSRRSSSLAPRPFAMVPLLLLVLSHPGKELFVASSADDRALTMRIKALSPTVSLDDARRVTYCAVTTIHGRLLSKIHAGLGKGVEPFPEDRISAYGWPAS